MSNPGMEPGSYNMSSIHLWATRAYPVCHFSITYVDKAAIAAEMKKSLWAHNSAAKQESKSFGRKLIQKLIKLYIYVFFHI